MHLYENDSYVDSMMHEIMDRSKYFDNEKDAFKDGLKLAKSLNYHVVNSSEL